MKPSKYRMRPDSWYSMKLPAYAADLLERAAISVGAEACDTWEEKVRAIVNAITGYRRLFPRSKMDHGIRRRRRSR